MIQTSPGEGKLIYLGRWYEGSLFWYYLISYLWLNRLYMKKIKNTLFLSLGGETSEVSDGWKLFQNRQGYLTFLLGHP